MANKSKYDERKVLNQLARKGINLNGGIIEVPTNGVITVGIHTWGKIDYLVHYCGWRYRMVTANEAQQQRAAERAARLEEKKAAKMNKRNK